MAARPPSSAYRWTITVTGVGSAIIVATDSGVRSIVLRKTPETIGLDPSRRDDVRLCAAAAALVGVIDGTRRDFPFSLDLDQGTPFSRRVWRELLTIPYGRTTTYSDIAKRLGLPVTASRAIGRANGSNPLPVVVPCHRVVGANGRLGGYTGGLDIKEHLLRIEGAIII